MSWRLTTASLPRKSDQRCLSAMHRRVCLFLVALVRRKESCMFARYARRILLDGGLCCDNRISQNPETSFALVRPYLRWMNHATPRQHITARPAGGGSARSTPRTKHDIIALSAKVMRVARDKRPDALSAGTPYLNRR